MRHSQYTYHESLCNLLHLVWTEVKETLNEVSIDESLTPICLPLSTVKTVIILVPHILSTSERMQNL